MVTITPPPAVSAEGQLPELAYRIEDSIGYLLRRIVVVMAAEIERQMEPLGLTEAQWKPLLRLYLAGDRSNVAALARGCMLDGGAMTRMLDRLEAKNLCRRVRSQEDRRVVHLELTPEGRAAAAQVPSVLVRVQDAVLDGISPEETDVLRGLLRRVLDNVEPLSTAGALADPAHSNENTAAP